jgi:hypothetical protein
MSFVTIGRKRGRETNFVDKLIPANFANHSSSGFSGLMLLDEAEVVI